MSRTALAFMSYVNEDDRHDNGWMTQFRERLSGEVRMHTGEPFNIFQDRKDIAWGQQWQERINQSLDAVTFLIPILTPAFFKSAACRDELERFLKREETLGRNDLILPVYYVNCPVLQDKAKREQDELAKTIAARQYADWRDLRFEDFTSPQLRKALAKMAQQIMEALERSQTEASRQQPEKESEKPSSSANTFQSSGGQQNIAQGSNSIGTQNNYYYAPPPTKSVPTVRPYRIVSAEGNYKTIAEAFTAATKRIHPDNPTSPQINNYYGPQIPIELAEAYAVKAVLRPNRPEKAGKEQQVSMEELLRKLAEIKPHLSALPEKAQVNLCNAIEEAEQEALRCNIDRVRENLKFVQDALKDMSSSVAAAIPIGELLGKVLIWCSRMGLF